MTTFFVNLCRVKRSFKPYQNEHNSVKDTGEKSKKPRDKDLKISMKILCITHLPFLSPNPKILKAFLKSLPTKMKPTKCPAREKKMRQEKRKKKGGEKAKSKSQDCRNFAFCACPNFASCYFASGSEGRQVYNL